MKKKKKMYTIVIYMYECSMSNKTSIIIASLFRSTKNEKKKKKEKESYLDVVFGSIR